MLSRRELMEKLAAGAAVAVAAGAGTAGVALARGKVNVPGGSEPGEGQFVPPPEAPAAQPAAPNVMLDAAAAPVSEPPPWDLLRPLALGAVVAHGWRVADLSPVVHGACVLTLQNGRGRTQRVHLCRNDGRPQGLVYTERMDLVVMNGGQGDLPTDEGLAQAVAEVAHVLAVNESKRPQAPLVTALLPHAERVRQFSDAEGGRLR